VIKLAKVGKIAELQRSKTLDISSGIRKPRKAVDRQVSDILRALAKTLREHAGFYWNVILSIKCSSR
jgi:hypothetical protein